MIVDQRYCEFEPPAALRDVVSCFWIRTSVDVGDVNILPDGCADVVWRRGRGVFVVGPDTSAKRFRSAADDVLVGMRFLPGAGGGMLGLPLDQLRDQRVDAADVDARLEIDPDLAPADVPGQMAAAVAGRPSDMLVRAAVRQLDRHDVRAVARELTISERHLRRRFHAAVGYGPQTFARVRRFRRFVHAVDAGRADLAALAFDAGYADQAHLTRETRRLAGVTPAELVRSR